MAIVAVALTAAVATFVAGKDYRDASASSKHFHRHAYTPSFDPITDVLRGLGPSAMSTNPGTPTRAIRAIAIYPRKVVLLAGGRPVRTIHLAKPLPTLKRVAERIGKPDWLATRGKTITANAAVIVQRRTRLRIGKPETTELVLHSTPGVLLGSVGAHVEIDGVAVHGTDRATPQISTSPRMDLGRPFVVAYRRSTMVIRDSSFRDLGRDWNASYGVSFSLGSTGSVQGSTFERNFIGLYTDHVHGLVVRHNVFRHNTLYGIDPHSHTTGMDVEDNLSESNGRHGIIFSDHVTGGIVRGNTTRGNTLNGIMMDASSTGNRIVRNLIEDNRGDGIVLANSPGNDISGNRILRNRIGIQARGASDDVTVTRNELAGNAKAAQGVSLAGGGNAVHGNGGQWKPDTVRAIWVAAGPLLVLLFLLTWLSQRKHNRPESFRREAVGTRRS
jgi:poly(beta-D-mannuronate) C5 epimerase